jgi:hypothetical protein
MAEMGRRWKGGYDAKLDYMKYYHRFTRHFNEFLEAAFERGPPTMSIEQLADRLAEVSQADPEIGKPIRLRTDVLRKYIKRYQRKDGEDRIEETITYRWKEPADVNHE